VSFGEPDTIAQEDLRFKAGAVMTTDNPCEPSCAEGQHYDNTWRYDTAAGYFVTGPLGD
jgi:hypothetical protein